MSDSPEPEREPDEGERPDSERERRDSEPHRRDSEIPDPEHRRRRRLEGVIPDLIKRAVELGVEKASEAPETFKHRMSELKLPKEAVAYIFAQVDETKNGMFRVFAKEVRDFLEHTNIAGEMQKLLTTVQFEVNTTIRFSPNDGPKDPPADAGEEGTDEGDETKPGRPEVKVDVFAKRSDGKNKKKLSKEE